MIVAMSGITIYILPNQSAQVSLLRFIFALVGGVLGLHGLILASMFLFGYLANFDSYNTPYLAPLAPYINNDQKDFIFKENITEMKTLPESIPNNKEIRLNDEQLKKDNSQESGENFSLSSMFGMNENEQEQGDSSSKGSNEGELSSGKNSENVKENGSGNLKKRDKENKEKKEPNDLNNTKEINKEKTQTKFEKEIKPKIKANIKSTKVK